MSIFRTGLWLIIVEESNALRFKRVVEYTGVVETPLIRLGRFRGEVSS